MTTTETRAERFVRDVAALKIPDPAARGATLWRRLGIGLMVLGPVLALSAYFMSHNTSDPLVQNDAIALGLAGIAGTVAGSAVYLRYALTGFLRFWMARQSHDLALLTDRLSERDTRDGLTSTDPSSR